MTTPGTSGTPSHGSVHKITSLPCGPRSKYLVLAFWIIVLAGTWPRGNVGALVKIFEDTSAALLYPALAVVVGVLLLSYRSPLLWLLPVTCAAVALAAAHAVLYPLTRHGLAVTGQSWDILVVLVVGASTGYGLLLVARYREELPRNADRHRAMAVALYRAGPAIIATAATVVTGMLCLLVAESTHISGLGPVVAIGIAVGLLVTITLLPAMLVMCGPWVLWPVRQPGYGTTSTATRGLVARTGRVIAAIHARSG